MMTSEAIRIVQSLADGVCPFTGKTFPLDSPYQHADIVRALFLSVEALRRIENRNRKRILLPENAGRAWDAIEEERLCEAFAAGKSIADLAADHQRTRGAIQSRLKKLGKIPPQPRRQF